MRNIRISITNEQAKKIDAIRFRTRLDKETIYKDVFAKGLDVVLREAKDAK